MGNLEEGMREGGDGSGQSSERTERSRTYQDRLGRFAQQLEQVHGIFADIVGVGA